MLADNAKPATSKPLTKAGAKPKPTIETYWENWNRHYPTDYGSLLNAFEMGQIGTDTGVNIVSMSFGDYSFATDSYGHTIIGGLNNKYKEERSYVDMKSEVQEAHDNGAIVKVAFGGAEAAMGNYIKSEEDAKQFCDTLAMIYNDTSINGIDFDVEAAAPENI